ncbi:MAG: histone deacetylase [Asgard group archaeon]|nr:histone deacetylase [Asgard group archaeon]
MFTFIDHEDYYKHKMDQIKESPRRLKIIDKILKNNGIYSLPSVRKISPEKASEETLRLIHDQTLIDKVKHGSMLGGTRISTNTIAGEHTFNAALRAAGGAILAGETALEGKQSIAYALTRPPGHHATRDKAMGFCFFNNIAISVENLITRQKVKRIAIIDFDNHYGNGLADLFYDRNDVLTISLHADPAETFPYQGRVHEIGERRGEGYNICIPLPIGTGDKEYLSAFEEFVPPIIEQFNPELLFFAAGYDGLKDDPYGYLGLTLASYYELGKQLSELSNDVCEGKVAFCLEGGYKFEELGEAFLLNITPFLKDFEIDEKKYKLKQSSGGNKSQLKDTMETLREILKDYWKL